MDFIERLQYFMTQKGINDNQLTVVAGLSIGLVGKAKKGGKAMTSANIEKILLAYPDLNPDWLLTGRGNMIKTNRTSDSPSSPIEVDCKPIKPAYDQTNQPLIDHLLKLMSEKDIEIGRLKERIEQLEKAKNASRMSFSSAQAELSTSPKD